LLGEGEDLSQLTDNNDIAVFLVRMDFDPIDERTDDFDSLRACRLINQHLLQSGDLSAVEVREIGVDSDLKVTLPGLQIGCGRTLASLQVLELIADTTRVAVTPGNEVQAAFDATK